MIQAPTQLYNDRGKVLQNTSVQTTEVNGQPATFYHSYSELVAFQIGKNPLVVMKNYWGATTGKHLNAIDGGRKKDRVSADEFKRLMDAHTHGTTDTAAQVKPGYRNLCLY
jgi:hypothetical protein